MTPPPETKQELIRECPFCGAAKIMSEGGDRDIKMVCQRCLAHGPTIFMGKSFMPEYRKEAVDTWNTRTTDAEIQRLRAELEKIRDADPLWWTVNGMRSRMESDGLQWSKTIAREALAK